MSFFFRMLEVKNYWNGRTNRECKLSDTDNIKDDNKCDLKYGIY